MTQVISFDGDAAAKTAIELAHKAKDLTPILNTIADAKTEMAGGALRTMVALRNIYGEELDAMPKPGEKDGNNRDEFSIEVTVDGVTKSSKTTFYTVFADNTPVGAQIVERIALCERAKRTDTVKTDIPADILEMVATKTIERELTKLKNKRGTFRASIKKAMELVFQFNAIAEVPLVECEPVWEDNATGEKVQATTKCIQVWQMNEDGKRVKYTDDLTIGTFLKLDAAKAIEAGGGFKALMATLQRGKKATVAESGTASDRRIASLDTMVGVVTELHRYVDEIVYDKDQADYNKLIKALKSGKATGEIISSFVELRNYLTDVIDAADLQDRYQDLQASEKKAA